MKKQRVFTIMLPLGLPVALVAVFLIGSGALAIGSDNYRLDWFTPLTGNGGRTANSTNYAINFTVGQAASGAASSTNYAGCLGYWCDTATQPVSGSCELLIITPQEFAPLLELLVEHKNAIGLSTEMITLEEIYENPALPGVDEPEQIKRAIALYEQSCHAKYVLLAGDVDKFPVRWASVRSNDGQVVRCYPVSDLYYADLYDSEGQFDTWDNGSGVYGNNGHFGEHRMENLDPDANSPYDVNLDRINLHPDVAVGRVPVSESWEMESYVTKVIRYEYLTYGSDWFHDGLLLANDSGRRCDPGIHFYEIQHALEGGDGFGFSTYITQTYYIEGGEYRPCTCYITETVGACLSRTSLNIPGHLDVFSDAARYSGWTDVRDKVARIGFLGRYGHTMKLPTKSPIGNYHTNIDNANRFTLAFTAGCGDGAFAGELPGRPARFASPNNLPYKTTDGWTIHMTVEDNGGYEMLDCKVLDEDTGVELDCDEVYSMTIVDDYISGAPRPAPLQTASCDSDFHPEDKLFARITVTETGAVTETGWIGMVGATEGTFFGGNGELMSMFFRSYTAPHPSVGSRNRLGDMWRSMQEHWLEYVTDDQGNFDATEHAAKYNDDDPAGKNRGGASMRMMMMFALFGDPSLRVGGVEGLEDTAPPTTVDDTDDNWHSENITVTLTATDSGSPPSGVQETRYRLDGGDWETGNSFVVAAPPDHSNDGVHTIDYYSVDFLGNTEGTKSTTVKIGASAIKVYLPLVVRNLP
jgi:hypothetical protein